ncbi:hypothetical protein BDM02DRAFT_3191711 [Thelephora ganbajun]|uniref:Uncharacterized protein n=1 Tax=Thelephora ganbajun TaxID=370292 RepID=A0ACB6Z102_THEGA|nr:hypothetical protein BDM02DRAFT_3191711 [Thelephora ganbajun]
MLVTCIGSSKNQASCTCTQFTPWKSKEAKCKGCGHRLGSHLDTPTLSHATETPATTAVPENKYIGRLFNSLKATAVHETARKEMLEGFRPPSPPANPTPSTRVTKGKVKARRASTRVRSQSATVGTVKFGRIVIFPCGDQNTRQFRFPTINATSLGPYVNAGLAVEANDTSGITFQLSWGTKQFNAFLRRLFPVLFTYFDTVSPGFKYIPDEPDNIGMKRIEYLLPYVLLEKDYRKYNIVDDTHPTATKYKEALSGDGTNAGFRAKGIFIVTKAPIPQAVLDGWFSPSPAPVIPAMCITPSLTTTTGNKRSRAVSSDSSEVSQGGSNYVPADIASAGNEETDTDDVKIIEKPPKKRIRISSLKAQDPSTFIQGSSKDGELDSLAQQLQQSASFDESYSKKVWPSDEGADLWNF